MTNEPSIDLIEVTQPGTGFFGVNYAFVFCVKIDHGCFFAKITDNFQLRGVWVDRENGVTALPVAGPFFDWASAAHENRKEASKAMITYFSMLVLFSIRTKNRLTNDLKLINKKGHQLF